RYLRKPVVVQVGRRSEAASTVTHAVYPVPRERKTTLLVELLKKSEMDSVLIFTRTKHGADRVVRHLNDGGIAATAMHADKSQGERTRALDGFKAGEIRVLVATDIAQRGLDVSGISHVINYDVPQQPEDYVHRIGRTGRAAATGDAFTFMAPDEIAMVRTIERMIGQQIPRISVTGYDFGTTNGADATLGDSPSALPVAKEPDVPDGVPGANGAPDPVATRKSYRRNRSVARRR
ncbi:MAG: ATP-dependent helicase, partial [Gemmatimonadota bacterium]|nr:ATP-dependent helicase [Gemmatimonadota bacterium]